MTDILFKWSQTIRHFRDGMEYELDVRVEVVRFQSNIPHFFSITCMEYPIIDGMRGEMDCTCHGGCDHKYIGKFFPEFIPFFDLHLCSRFGERDLFAVRKEINSPYYTDEEKQIIRDVERRVMLRKYLHARAFLELLRKKSLQP